jgi:hypothetical protein
MILRHKKIIVQISIAIIFPLSLIAQPGSIPEFFGRIGTEPQIIHCKNELEVNNRGGHLQGVQLLVKNDVEYAILSGSSDSYAYYLVARLGDYKQVLSVNELMYKPFKHAGGIQINDGLMVVGIEDNETRDKSKVCIYEIENPDQPPVKPLVMIDRNGEPSRSTAGCCGITNIGGRYLIVVGDWDTKHLDFYLYDENRMKDGIDASKKIHSINTEKADRSGWADSEWLSYQNINLLRDTDGQLYLIGMGQNKEQENRADLFLIEHKNFTDFNVKKLMTKSFSCRQGANFRSGAGIYRQADGRLKLISCGSHIRNSLVMNLFD